MRKILKDLPNLPELKKLSQSLAILDAIISPEWENRYYSFNKNWTENEMMGSMRNGSGDEYFILFNEFGAIIKGFAHESLMNPHTNNPPKVWKGIFENVPKEFETFLSEPAFVIEDTTFCIWRKITDECWQIGDIEYPNVKDADGMEELLGILEGNPQKYKDFAEEYYEISLELEDIEKIYRHQPLSENLVKKLNSEVLLEDLQDDIDEIGYPI